MNPQLPQIPNESAEVSAETSWIANILARTKLALLAAVVATGVSGKPQEVQAQEVYTIQPAIYIIPYTDFSEEQQPEMSEAEYDQLLDEMTADILQRQEAGTDEIEPWITIANVLEAIRIIGDDTFFTSFVWFYAASKDSSFAAEEIYNKLSDVQRIPVIHAEAISLWRDIYVENMITLNPQYTDGRLARAPEDEKRTRAARNFNEILEDLVAWRIPSADSLKQLAEYTPEFVEVYLLNPEFSWEFPQTEIRIAVEVIKWAQQLLELQEQEQELIARNEESRLRIEAIREANRVALIEIARVIQERRASGS